MKTLQNEQMQDLKGGCEWVWKSQMLSTIPVDTMGGTCQDLYDYFGGDACAMAAGASAYTNACLDFVGSGGGGWD